MEKIDYMHYLEEKQNKQKLLGRKMLGVLDDKEKSK
jgi:hypothetical protein